MSSTLMMERTGMGMPGLGVPGLAPSHVGTPTGMPMHPSYMVVPKCTFKLEKVSSGMKITCVCEDKTASSMVQNLCTMLAGGMCSCCVMLNGMTVCYINLSMGLTKCEPTDSGVCITTSCGDHHFGEMLQACCDCLSCMLEAGCTCCLLMNHTPICCGSSESGKSGKGKSPR